MPTMCKRTFGTVSLWALSVAAVVGSGLAWAQESPPKPAAATPAAEANMMVREVEYVAPTPMATPCPSPAAEGTACTPPPDDSVKNFKMVVPADWDVKFNVGSHAILMEPQVKIQPSAENPVVADPSMSVVVTRNPIPIDDEGLNEYAGEIERNLNRQGDEPENAAEAVAKVFKVFGKTLVDLPNGHKGYLYYVSGVLSQINVRQAILVASTQKVQFRVTLTDHEVTFDKTLERLYPIMSSIQLNSTPLERQSGLLIWLPWVTIGGILLLGLVVTRLVLLRRTRALISEFGMTGGAPSSTVEAPSSAVGESAVSQKPASEYPDEDDV